MTSKTPKKTVLIIDDDDDMAHALERILSVGGYAVIRASDGNEGVRMAVREKPDLILLDFMMPGKNGFDACADIRQVPELDHAPILALTAFGREIGEIYGSGKDGNPCPGICDYLEKPVEPNVLLERIALALHD